MAYFNGYQQYQPQYYQYAQPVQDNLGQLRQQQMLPTSMSVTNGDDRIWVQGEAGAKGYLVVPGNTVPLWDSETQRIFIKSVNANGIPSMQRIRYTFEDQDTRPEKSGIYVTKDEFNSKIREIMEAINGTESNADDTAV